MIEGQSGSATARASTPTAPTGAGAKFWNQWLSFGQVPQWVGTGYEVSLIRGDAMRPMHWLPWCSGQSRRCRKPGIALGESMAVPDLRQSDESNTAVPHAKIIGGRFTFTPFQSLELGARRALCSRAGKGRPQSFSSFWDGFTGKDNTGTDNEPGNQLAGFDFKFKTWADPQLPVSFYGQMIGEGWVWFTYHQPICFLGGVEGHHGWGGDAVNWYLEAWRYADKYESNRI